ncbi:MAG: IS110 family transposase [Micropruina sp.]|nr:IS110 family transposase [Micropruina sp.]
MTIVAYARQFVIGVDTHARNHVLAVVAGNGQFIDTASFPTSQPGLARAIDWAARRTGGDLSALWVIEGAASYGAQLAAASSQAGYQVVEAPQMSSRGSSGKSDTIDARRIAEAVLPLDETRLRHPRSDNGERAALQILITARDQMSTERTAAINALTALLRTIDLGIDARHCLRHTQIVQIASWEQRDEPIAAATARTEAARLATRITALDTELATNKRTITTLIQATPAAGLLAKTGIGPVTAAIALTAWSHPGRLRSEAAFAALAGVNPIPASSGNTQRHRLNRGGDRRLNRALHMAILTRMTHDPDTRTYVQRRTAQGRTTKEIRRCLKRYLARHIHRYLTTAYTQTTLDKT